MGLDVVSADGKVTIWHGAYTAFARWRAEVARHHGAKEYYAVYGGTLGRDIPQVLSRDDPASFLKFLEHAVKGLVGPESPQFQAEWKRIEAKQPALFVLLSHSDCDGQWSPSECKQVVECVEAVVDKLPLEKDTGHIGDWRVKTRTLLDGLRYCMASGQDAKFG